MNRHRSSHPADGALFADAALPVLRAAVYELSWLMERGYPPKAALALVGDRHGLRARQRKAVLRCAVGDSALARRTARRLAVSDLGGRTLWIDGFNCIITLEAAMAGGVILRGRDRVHRDLASVYGSYRRVEETRRAIQAMVDVCGEHGVAGARWLLDRPVSNSGRLEAMIADAAPPDIEWQVELVYNPDRELCTRGEHVVASSDSGVLDHCGAWVDVPGAVIAAGRDIGDAWIVDLGAG